LRGTRFEQHFVELPRMPHFFGHPPSHPASCRNEDCLMPFAFGATIGKYTNIARRSAVVTQIRAVDHEVARRSSRSCASRGVGPRSLGEQ
jgi:hypothetical protein